MSSTKFRIVAISDTHMAMDRVDVPDGDILIHAGDLTFQGTVAEVTKELFLMGKLPHKHKILVAGNHDWMGQHNPSLLKRICEENRITYLDETSVEVEGLKIFGSPWTPAFFNWAFNAERGADIKKHWDLIPSDTDVLITHGAPYGILDIVPRNMKETHQGCEELLLAVDRLKQLKLHIFGHIHESYGTFFDGRTHFINASIMDGKYRPKNQPIIISI